MTKNNIVGNMQMRGMVGGFTLVIAGLFALSAQAAGSYDGVYEGNASTMSGRCSPSMHPVFRVADNHISAKWGGTNVIDADVAADGSLKNGPAAMRTTTTGSISGKTLTMDVSNPGCAIHYVLDKRS